MKPPDARRWLAAAVDLGSTTLKAGLLGPDGRLTVVRSLAAPELRAAGNLREGDVEEYASAARRLLEAVAATAPPGLPLGIASQRSTLVLWDPRTGRPLTPMISWQDRRAADWCARQSRLEAEVVRRTGLPLSAHYAGPKLATIQEDMPHLARALRTGEALFGTLETYLIWHWTGGRTHETDLTMAARTLMLDLERNDWSPELLRHFGVPLAVLPRVVPSAGRSVSLGFGLLLRATLADQAAGALAVFDEPRPSTLVNLGTGAFVLRPADRASLRRPGYLTGPILGAHTGHRYALEGAINGAGPAVDRFGCGPTLLPVADPCPEGFAVPDQAGLGAPYWRPDVGLTLSLPAQQLDGPGQRRVVMEGLLFRVREILDDLDGTAAPARVILSGGLTQDAAVAQGLAALLGRPVEQLQEQEAVLIGAARLAADLSPYADPPTLRIEPDARGAYLQEKYPRWRHWLRSLLDR